MAVSSTRLLTEQCLIVDGIVLGVPSTTTPDYVSLKNYPRLTVVIKGKNTTTVTGSAITLKQAQAVANTGEKALAFSTAYRNIDTGADDRLAAFTVSSNTFTTDATNNKTFLYVIEVQDTDLDLANGFDCVRLGTGDATNATLAVTYLLWPAKYGDSPANMKSAIID